MNPIIDNDGNKKWWVNGKRHCEEGPAVEWAKAGIKWIEDVLSSTNYDCPIYPKRVFEYKCW